MGALDVPRGHERSAEHHGLYLFGWQWRVSFLDSGEIGMRNGKWAAWYLMLPTPHFQMNFNDQSLNFA